MNAPKISVVVPTCNRPEALAACLSAIWPQIPEDGSVEILVCDDGCNELSADLLRSRFSSTRWHRGPRRGPAANRNLGARKAAGEWLIFVDDDCIPCPAWLAAYAKAIEHFGATAVSMAGATVHSEAPPSLLWEAPHNPKGASLISCNMALPKALFFEVGGFDERFPAAAFEDTEFEARLRLLSIPIQFVPGACVDHPLRQLPGSRKLALRWEARVISSFDFGASSWQVLVRLPEHIFKVIVSRFRSVRLCGDNLRASAVFAAEFIHAICLLPAWIRRYRCGPRSPFWTDRVAEGKAPVRFGL